MSLRSVCEGFSLFYISKVLIKDGSFIVTFYLVTKENPNFFIKFYCNNRNLQCEIGSNRYNYSILYTLVDSNRMNLAVHLVAMPNGNSVDPILYQSTHNIRLKFHRVQPNRHHPRKIIICYYHFKTNILKNASVTLHKTLCDPTTPIHPCDSMSD